MFPGGLDAVLQLADAHMPWLENDVLAVVKFPVFGQQSAFRLQPFVERRIRKWRHHGEPRQVNARRDGELRGLRKDIRAVVIEPEDKAALESDAVCMQSLDHSREIGRAN